MAKTLQITPGRISFALIGALLSTGAPLGWLVIRWFAGANPASVVTQNPVLILYLFLPTMLVFAGVGYIMGGQWEELRAANDRLVKLATRDELTGLFNARRFWEDFDRACRHSARHQEPLFVAIIDLDHFKAVNDTYGHLQGDRLLEAVAQSMTDAMRGDEPLYRVGGEEFAAILTQISVDDAQKLAERLRRAVLSTEVPLLTATSPQDTLYVSASIGVAGDFCQPSLRYQELYDRADQALYKAKEGGRDRVVVAYQQTSPPPASKPAEQLTS